ncbi:MAG: trypsin-like peptidase domain-containing protein [Deltaproteobacteria bacterium]|jgi:S1-C subfamily serine protease|nr:trypsin-like peptidase domain-containing protein [Deltaproteobacteria bacterium]
MTVKHLIPILLLSALFAGTALAQSAPQNQSPITNESLDLERKTREMAVMVEKSTVFVMVVNGSVLKNYGTGFIVADGYIVTSGCLFSNATTNEKIFILNNLIKLTQAEIVKVECGGKEIGDPNLALLKFQPPQGAPIQPLTFSNEEYVNYWVAAWGYQSGIVELDKNFQCLEEMKTGCLKAPPVAATNGEVYLIDGNVICHTAQIDSGNFGGPLVTGSGKVVGINSWNNNPTDEALEDSFPVGLAIPSSTVVSFLKENGVTPKVDKDNFPIEVAAAQSPPSPAPAPVTSENIPDPEKTQAAASREMDLGSFKLNIPVGWSILESSQDSILIVTDDGVTTMAVISNRNDGKDILEIAKAYSKAADGNEPEGTASVSGLYSFEFDNNGKDALAFVFPWKQDKHFLVYISGNMSNPDVYTILNSLIDGLA